MLILPFLRRPTKERPIPANGETAVVATTRSRQAWTGASPSSAAPGGRSGEMVHTVAPQTSVAFAACAARK